MESLILLIGVVAILLLLKLNINPISEDELERIKAQEQFHQECMKINDELTQLSKIIESKKYKDCQVELSRKRYLLDQWKHKEFINKHLN